MAVRYGTLRFIFCSEVRYAGTVRFFWNGTGTVRWYGTLQKLNWSTVRWYGTVEGARYVVRKFRTYRTVLPSLVRTHTTGIWTIIWSCIYFKNLSTGRTTTIRNRTRYRGRPTSLPVFSVCLDYNPFDEFFKFGPQPFWPWKGQLAHFVYLTGHTPFFFLSRPWCTHQASKIPMMMTACYGLK